MRCSGGLIWVGRVRRPAARRCLRGFPVTTRENPVAVARTARGSTSSSAVDLLFPITFSLPPHIRHFAPPPPELQFGADTPLPVPIHEVALHTCILTDTSSSELASSPLPLPLPPSLSMAQVATAAVGERRKLPLLDPHPRIGMPPYAALNRPSARPRTLPAASVSPLLESGSSRPRKDAPATSVERDTAIVIAESLSSQHPFVQAQPPASRKSRAFFDVVLGRTPVNEEPPTNTVGGDFHTKCH